MKRKTLLLIISFALAASLSACGSDKFPPENDSSAKIIAEPEKPSDAEESVWNESENEPVMEEEAIDLDKEVVFSDEHLASLAQREAGSLTVGALQKITDLSVGVVYPLKVPEELAYFPNLKSLRVSSMENGDISWLSYLPNLEYLELNYNHIDNIEEIGNCAGLVCLIIDSYNITDISFLEKLKSLEEFKISSDTLQDFSPINCLTNLRVLDVYSGTAESLNIDFSNLTNLQLINISGGPQLTDVTALNSLNIYAEPTFDAEFLRDENYKGIYNTYNGNFGKLYIDAHAAENYRDNYSNDKRPETECFKTINIDYEIPLTNESIETLAYINYKYLQALDFHIDEYYDLAGVSEERYYRYREAWDNLVLANGDPLAKNDAVTVTPLPDLENFNNPQIYLDGRYIGLYRPLEDMVTGYTINGSDGVDYIHSVYIGARDGSRITLCSESGKEICRVTVKNTDENISKPISECEVTEIYTYRDTDIELRLPQGNEKNEYVSWDYPYQNFTDIYENCFHVFGECLIFCNDKCDIIQISAHNDAIASISLYRLTPDEEGNVIIAGTRYSKK